jgi:hypothetical protein
MAELTRELATKKVASIFIYSHEAHPGEHFPHHTSFSQKLAHARAFRDSCQIERPILVDALDGACHRAYGSMPNMTWIVDRAGRPLYKSDWTDTESLRAFFADRQAAQERRRSQGSLQAPFRVERLEFRLRDEQAFLTALERNGPRAVAEFRKYLQRQRRGKEEQEY